MYNIELITPNKELQTRKFNYATVQAVREKQALLQVVLPTGM